MSAAEKRCVRTLNGMVPIVTGLLWLQLPLIIALLPDTGYIFASFLLAPALWALIPLLNHAGRHTAARLLFSLSTLLLVALTAVQVGAATENHLFMITIFLGGFIIYPPGERRWLWLVVVLSALSLVMLEWFYNQYGRLIDFPPEFVIMTRWSSLSALFLIILGITAYHYSVVTKTERDLETEHQRSEQLLLNILPEETARELKDKGSAEARLIDQVTVLFTDFKGFTAMSEKLTPGELVRDLDECFSAFDRICEQHGIEKIKTIGDAYMAAGGLPAPTATHAQDAVRTALDMAEFMAGMKARKIAAGLPFFELRIGLHTGPVVAGIVGIRKFQYDIWGDTVNTASRMESSGEVGRVNISEATHELVKDDFRCAFRGEVEAKGKGRLGMYFVAGNAPAD